MSKSLKIENISKANVFNTPAQYFEQLPEGIWQKIKLSEGVQVSEISHHQIFSVPAHYFEQLPEMIQKRISLREGMSLAQIPPHLVFTTPHRYFEELANSIEQKIFLLEAQSSQLVSKEPVFSTPDNYFDDLASQIQHRVTSEKSFWDQVQERLAIFTNAPANRMRWVGAMAAVVVMVVSGFWVFNNTDIFSDEQGVAATTIKKRMFEERQDLATLTEVRKNVKSTETTTGQEQMVKPVPQAITRGANSTLNLNNLTEEEVTGFLADLSPDELDVIDETTDPEDQAVEVFLIQALQSKKDILYEQIKDIDLKAIQNSQLFRK